MKTDKTNNDIKSFVLLKYKILTPCELLNELDNQNRHHIRYIKLKEYPAEVLHQVSNRYKTHDLVDYYIFTIEEAQLYVNLLIEELCKYESNQLP